MNTVAHAVYALNCCQDYNVDFKVNREFENKVYEKEKENEIVHDKQNQLILAKFLQCYLQNILYQTQKF